MTTLEIAARFSAKRCGKGFVACCPAHDDRHPSLAIAEGRDGRTLLHCFKGCQVEAIARAARLTLGDLFDGIGTPIQRAPRRPSADELCVALAVEERNFRERHAFKGLLLATELNRIRETIARRYRIELAQIGRPLWEGAYGGRERDPAWRAFFDWALGVASVKLIGAPIAFDETVPPPRRVLIAAEEIASDAMRSLEREARNAQSEVAV